MNHLFSRYVFGLPYIWIMETFFAMGCVSLVLFWEALLYLLQAAMRRLARELPLF
jgi:hypothetical protein